MEKPTCKEVEINGVTYVKKGLPVQIDENLGPWEIGKKYFN